MILLVVNVWLLVILFLEILISRVMYSPFGYLKVRGTV